MTIIDWIIIAVFFVCMIAITLVTKRMTVSVAGFLSSERLAGRYLLTIAQSMAFIAAIGIIGNFEQIYRNGLGGQWWGMMFLPVNSIIAMSGFVIYRYRETRVLTMAQFLETRYSRRVRVFSGVIGFISGVLNCAVFPMVTARFLVYFLRLPETFDFLGLSLPSYHTAMFIMVACAVLSAISGGQITIMITDFFQGILVTVAFISGIIYMLILFGWDGIMDTLCAAEKIIEPANLEMVSLYKRPEGASMVHPFKMTDIPDFGLPFFLMMVFLQIIRVGIWQGGAGYMAAAKTPHEAKMGNILGGWRWLLVGVGTNALAIGAYVLAWSPNFQEARANLAISTAAITDRYIQSQMFVPLALFEMLPQGMIGLMAILMIGASISTDNSAYHSWGSIFLQDIVIPLRKKPFTKEQHLKYLRWSIVLIGVIAFVFSSIWTLKEFINMWFQITGSIYIGGASCAIIGGLYWKKATTAGAWSGLVTGSVLSIGGIIFRQIWPDTTFPWNDQVINGLHISVFTVLISYIVFITVSLLTCRENYDMDRLLHRGKYALKGEHASGGGLSNRPWIVRKMGITAEFSRFDIAIYVGLILWTVLYSAVFIIGTIYNLTHDVSTQSWRVAWGWIIGVQVVIAFATGIWFALGGARDTVRLFKDLAKIEANDNDDGVVHKD